MAHPIVSTPRLVSAMDRIRPVAPPGVVERLSHRAHRPSSRPTGRKGRTFASVHGRARSWDVMAVRLGGRRPRQAFTRRWSVEGPQRSRAALRRSPRLDRPATGTFPRWTGTRKFLASSKTPTPTSWSADLGRRLPKPGTIRGTQPERHRAGHAGRGRFSATGSRSSPCAVPHLRRCPPAAVGLPRRPARSWSAPPGVP